jgi:nucleoside-diphosphate-sugar epimerase
MKLLVTGANGFVGRALLASLCKEGNEVQAAVRTLRADFAEFAAARGAGVHAVGEMGPHTDWLPLLRGVETIVHLAARVHEMDDAGRDTLPDYLAVNCTATLNLAQAAAAAGVKRLVFLSSVKVCGECASSAAPFTEDTPPRPQGPYAQSKWEAEQGLGAIAAQTGLEVVILRPALVYGPGVKANFLRLMHWVRRGWPLPFGQVNNCRSLLYLGNLVDAIRVCLEHPAAAGKTFLLSDGEDVSTPELVRLIAQALGRPPRLLSFPPAWLRAAGKLAGRGKEVDRLLGSLCVDSGKIRRELGWQPPHTLDAGIRETVRAYVHGLEAGPA